MIDATTIDWRRLTRFASEITLKAVGAACVVRAGAGDGYWGAQGHDGRFYEIELSLSQPRTQLMRTLLHEIGHAANGHTKTKTIAAGGYTLRTVDSIADADFREKVRERLHVVESEADAFADTAQEVFETQLGPAWVEWPFVG